MTVRRRGAAAAVVVAATMAAGVLASCGGLFTSATMTVTAGGNRCVRVPPRAIPTGSTEVAGPAGAEVHSHSGPQLPPTWPSSVRLPAGASVVGTAVAVEPCGYVLRANVDLAVGPAAAEQALVAGLSSAGYRQAGVLAGLPPARTVFVRGATTVVLAVTAVGAGQAFATLSVPVGTVSRRLGDT